MRLSNGPATNTCYGCKVQYVLILAQNALRSLPFCSRGELGSKEQMNVGFVCSGTAMRCERKLAFPSAFVPRGFYLITGQRGVCYV